MNDPQPITQDTFVATYAAELASARSPLGRPRSAERCRRMAEKAWRAMHTRHVWSIGFGHTEINEDP